MELRVVDGPARGHRSLRAERAGRQVRTGQNGTMGQWLGSGHHQRGRLRTPGGAGEAGGQRRNPTVVVLQSAVAVGHDCGAVVESLMENGDRRIWLETK